MTQVLSIKDTRNRLADVVNQVAISGDVFVITKFGKPIAALVTFDDYKKIMNPAKRYTKEEWDKGFALMDKARSNTKKYPQKEIEKAIGQAIKEVRESKRV